MVTNSVVYNKGKSIVIMKTVTLKIKIKFQAVTMINLINCKQYIYIHFNLI